MKLDPAGCFKAVHGGHQRIKQHNIGGMQGEQLDGLLPMLCLMDLVPKAFDQAPQDHAVGRVVISHQHHQRPGTLIRVYAVSAGTGHDYSMLNSCSKLEILRTLRTSGLQ